MTLHLMHNVPAVINHYISCCHGNKGVIKTHTVHPSVLLHACPQG